MQRVGVNADSQVVLYAASPRPGIDRGLMWCTRAWWILHHFGVRSAVLNGGFEKWVAEGRPVSASPPSANVAPGGFVPSGDGRHAVASKSVVLEALSDPSARVVDTLSAASFAGTDKAVYGPRKGHITGAVNVPMPPGKYASPVKSVITSAAARLNVL